MQVSACRLIVHVLYSIIHASFLQLFHATHIDWQISSIADSCTLAQCTHKNECATTKHKVIWNRLEMCMCCAFTDERARDTQRNCIQSHRPNGKQSTNHDHWSSHSCSAHQLFSIQVDCFLFCCCSCCSLDKCTPVPLRRWCTTQQPTNPMNIWGTWAWSSSNVQGSRSMHASNLLLKNKCYHIVLHSFRFLHTPIHMCG